MWHSLFVCLFYFFKYFILLVSGRRHSYFLKCLRKGETETERHRRTHTEIHTQVLKTELCPPRLKL